MLNDQSPMPFGRYKGTPLEKVPASHLLRLYELGRCSQELAEYVEDNMHVLEFEIANQKQYE